MHNNVLMIVYIHCSVEGKRWSIVNVVHLVMNVNVLGAWKVLALYPLKVYSQACHCVLGDCGGGWVSAQL